MSTALAIARAQATAGDPRRPQDISPYKKPPEGEKLPNVRLLFALGCGMGAMALHIPYLNWASLVLICSAVANADSAFEWNQLMQTVVFNIIGLSSSYILPYWQQKPSQGAAAAAQAAAAQAGPLT